MSPIIQILVGENPGKYIQQKGGEELVFRCPKCGKQKYYVNVQKGMAHCFVCQWSKRLPRMLRKLERAVLSRPKEKVDTGAIEIPGFYTPRNYPPKCIEYLVQRGLIGIPDFWGMSFDTKLQNRVIIPVYEDGILRSYVARSFTGENPKEIHGPDCSSYFFPGYTHTFFNNVSRPCVVLVEGIFDAMALEVQGYAALALMGSNLSDQQAGKLIKANPKEVIIMMDGDEAGWKASIKIRNKLMKRMDPFKIKIATVPEGKDPDELTNEEVRRAIKEAV